MRSYSAIDNFLINADEMIATLFGNPKGSRRENPAKSIPDEQISDSEKQLSASLMRVNHVGEVCAQALYQAQAVTSRNPEIRQQMRAASIEENDHLSWCDERLKELDGQKSLLNPLWYGGAFAIGAVAGMAGDRWNLGFVAETERQVVKHLNNHLNRLPKNDLRSRAIVKQMSHDEAEHATMAVTAGAAELPEPIKKIMGLASKIMTRTAEKI
ncbi:MAG: ubiquinone biosynthesis monooxygenase Coq7 [Parasphingorhabdus sp.]|jgi:ubiquinone biosynthesis monooxygenase Coq7